MIHGFVRMAALIDRTQQVLDEVAVFLKNPAILD